jgi:hypothetical protein
MQAGWRLAPGMGSAKIPATSHPIAEFHHPVRPKLAPRPLQEPIEKRGADVASVEIEEAAKNEGYGR